MKKLNISQLRIITDFLNTIASAFFTAGVVVPIFSKQIFFSEVFGSIIAGILVAFLLITISVKMMERTK